MNKYLIIILLFSGLISCKHELEQPSWSTQWTAPVAYSSLDIHQLKDSTIQYDTRKQWLTASISTRAF